MQKSGEWSDLALSHAAELEHAAKSAGGGGASTAAVALCVVQVSVASLMTSLMTPPSNTVALCVVQVICRDILSSVGPAPLFGSRPVQRKRTRGGYSNGSI